MEAAVSRRPSSQPAQTLTATDTVTPALTATACRSQSMPVPPRISPSPARHTTYCLATPSISRSSLKIRMATWPRTTPPAWRSVPTTLPPRCPLRAPSTPGPAHFRATLNTAGTQTLTVTDGNLNDGTSARYSSADGGNAFRHQRHRRQQFGQRLPVHRDGGGSIQHHCHRLSRHGALRQQRSWRLAVRRCDPDGRCGSFWSRPAYCRRRPVNRR